MAFPAIASGAMSLGSQFVDYQGKNLPQFTGAIDPYDYDIPLMNDIAQQRVGGFGPELAAVSAGSAGQQADAAYAAAIAEKRERDRSLQIATPLMDVMMSTVGLPPLSLLSGIAGGNLGLGGGGGGGGGAAPVVELMGAFGGGSGAAATPVGGGSQFQTGFQLPNGNIVPPFNAPSSLPVR